LLFPVSNLPHSFNGLAKPKETKEKRKRRKRKDPAGLARLVVAPDQVLYVWLVDTIYPLGM
jgi:hypothetical protein